MSTTAADVASVRRASAGGVARRGALALVLAVAVNLVVVFLADLAAVAPDLAHLSYGRVALFTAAGVVGATVVYGALTRLVADPDRTFVAVAVVAVVLSVVPTALVIPGEPGATTLGTAALALMHLPPAAAAVVFLAGFGRRRGTDTDAATPDR